MIDFGLTGGIGSGKSTVAEMLAAKGAELIDADVIVRELQAPGQPVFTAMVERWGDRIVADDGTLNRAAVAEIAFGDEDELKALNDIVHPVVAAEMAARRKTLEGADADTGTTTMVINDIPLLVLADGTSNVERYKHLAGVIVVDTPIDVAVERLMTYRQFSKEDAEARMANQATREDRLAHADFVIDNGGTLDELPVQVDTCWTWMRSLAD